MFMKSTNTLLLSLMQGRGCQPGTAVDYLVKCKEAQAAIMEQLQL